MITMRQEPKDHRRLPGISGTDAAAYAGVTYRQLDYWAREEVLVPSIAEGRGTGRPRAYSEEDVYVLCVLRELSRMGAQLRTFGLDVEPVRRAIREHAHWLVVSPSAQVELVYDDDMMLVMDACSIIGAWVLNLRKILLGCPLWLEDEAAS